MIPMEVYETLPIVPLRDVVVFPHMMMPFVIGRPSVDAGARARAGQGQADLPGRAARRLHRRPAPEDIYTMGCVANVVQSLKLPDGNIKVLVEGVDRARPSSGRKTRASTASSSRCCRSTRRPPATSRRR
jgi:ATP-dependent Lon protease